LHHNVNVLSYSANVAGCNAIVDSDNAGAIAHIAIVGGAMRSLWKVSLRAITVHKT
jgi:hypothetical protein